MAEEAITVTNVTCCPQVLPRVCDTCGRALRAAVSGAPGSLCAPARAAARRLSVAFARQCVCSCAVVWGGAAASAPPAACACASGLGAANKEVHF
jgi:hypothetical protein